MLLEFTKHFLGRRRLGNTSAPVLSKLRVPQAAGSDTYIFTPRRTIAGSPKKAVQPSILYGVVLSIFLVR